MVSLWHCPALGLRPRARRALRFVVFVALDDAQSNHCQGNQAATQATSIEDVGNPDATPVGDMVVHCISASQQIAQLCSTAPRLKLSR